MNYEEAKKQIEKTSHEPIVFTHINAIIGGTIRKFDGSQTQKSIPVRTYSPEEAVEMLERVREFGCQYNFVWHRYDNDDLYDVLREDGVIDEHVPRPLEVPELSPARIRGKHLITSRPVTVELASAAHRVTRIPANIPPDHPHCKDLLWEVLPDRSTYDVEGAEADL